MADDLIEAEGAAEVLRRGIRIGAASAEPMEAHHAGASLVYALVPDEYHLEDFTDRLTRLQPYPQRKTGGFTFTRHASFIEYVNQHQGAGSTIYAGESGKFTAILNDHQANREVPLTDEDRDDADLPAEAEAEVIAGAPGWGDHVARFAPKITTAWEKWSQFAGTWWSQMQFAEFIEDRIGEIVDPDGAILYEITTNLTVNTNMAFKSQVNRSNGRVQLSYVETGDEGGGKAGDLIVPEGITIQVAPFEGTVAQIMHGRFRWRIDGGKASFHYSLGEEMERVLREAIALIANSVAGDTGLPVLYGAPASG